MSRTQSHAPAQPKPADRTASRKGAAPRWHVIARTADPEPRAHIPLEQLRRAGGPGLCRAELPFRPALAAMFGGALPALEVLTGPAVEAALDARDAEAATQDGILLLRRDAPLPIVAHELAHVLQTRRPPAPPDPVRAETEARLIEFRATRAAPLPPVSAALAADTLAFRMQGALAVQPRETPPGPAAPQPADIAAPAPELAPEPGPAPALVAANGSTPGPANDTAPPTPAPTADASTAEALGPPRVPDLTAAVETAAANVAAADAALASARDAEGVMAAFRAAPPSVKAREAAGLQARIAAASASARASEDAALPPLTARMSPGDPLPAQRPVQAPPATARALEPAAPRPAAPPALAPMPAPERAAANDDLAPALERDFTPGDPLALRGSLASVQTRDDGVSASAGPRPALPLTGETDPARITAQTGAATAEAAGHHAAAAQAVLDGPGPERVQLRETAEPVAIPARAAPDPLAPLPAPSGPADFAGRGVDAQTVALFDQAHGPAMRASLAGAEARLDRAANDRDTGRATELRRADEEQARLNAEADRAQQAEVVAGRDRIQSARRQTLDDQASGVQALRDQAASARTLASDGVTAEAAQAQTRIAQDFARAETQAEAEVDRGEADAASLRDAARREAEDASWWDRAVSWVKAQLAALTRAINAVFDAVRAAVRRIIDAVRTAAMALIDYAARRIKSLIEGLGALLRGLVNTLLADLFPRLAAALNRAIDAAVAIARAAVDLIAATLKRGIQLLANALAAALDALLAAWQAAMNAALVLVNAALSGDWAALARLVLTPILMALGIEPQAFFQLFGRAAQALDLILANPGGFVQNLLEAVKGGIRRFGDNLRRHLIAGMVIWLTGPLGGGIVMPARFDLWGLLDIARQALGLTLATVRRVAVRILGEGAVQRIEYVLNYVRALISGGWAGLWEQLTSDLATLRDMALEQIRSFLLEKVVIAGIMWLASLFNPVGALVKLVQTIWNFIKFLRTQMARIWQVVQVVLNTVWEIASGALEPPIRGVESVLGRLVPVVMDLLARLLGVGGIPEKVQEVLRAVQLRIETALERLMRRVLAAFGVRGRPAAAGDSPDDLMPPRSFAGGGESHTLYIHEQGAGVVPMMRSTPMPVAGWLQGLRGEGLVQIGNRKRPRWTPGIVAQKRVEIEPLIAEAIGKEATVDEKGEAANAAEDRALANANGAPPPPAPALLLAGDALADNLSRILARLGLANLPLDQIFARDIGRMRADLAENLRIHVLPLLDAAQYGALTWDGFAARLATDNVTEPWAVPAGSTGAARRFTGGSFDAAIRREAIDILAHDERPKPEDWFAAEDAVDRLFAGHLAQALNTPGIRARLTARMLGSRNTAMTHWLGDFRDELATAVRRFAEPGEKPDFDIRSQITGATYYGLFEDAAGARATVYRYYAVQKADGSPEGSGTSHPLTWFLRPDGGSSRAGRNREWVGDAIRAARPRMHEWVPASIGYAAIEATAGRFRADGSLDEASGVANFIEFQNEVRTPTTDLVFKPGSFAEVSSATLPYISRAHDLSGKGYNTLTPAEKASFYPSSGPHFGQEVPVLQAHAGGLRARAERGGALDWTHAQDASPRWHINLQARITTRIEGDVAMRAMAEVRDAILGFYAETIWHNSPDLSDTRFDLYQQAGSSAIMGYAQIKAHAATVFQRNYDELRDNMNRVLGS